MLYGIDTSHHQQFSDYKLLNKSNKAFVFVKATEKTWSDPMFKTHCEGFAKTKLMRGAYHFLRFTSIENDGVSQGNAFVNAIVKSGCKMDLPPVLDIEDDAEQLTPDKCISIVKQWLTTVETRLNVTPIIYTGGWYWRDEKRMANTKEFAAYPLWTSLYTHDASKSYLPLYGGWQKPAFWQYDDRGSVEGLTGSNLKIDLNVFTGDIDAFWKLLVDPINDFKNLSNDKIQAVQYALDAKKFYTGEHNGDFTKTRKALNEWQKLNGFPEGDGFDPHQWQALFDLIPSAVNTQPVVSSPIRPGSQAIPSGGVVISDKLNIRAGASATNPLVSTPLSRGQSVSILEENNGWYKVKTQVEGWVKKDFVRAQ